MLHRQCSIIAERAEWRRARVRLSSERNSRGALFHSVEHRPGAARACGAARGTRGAAAGPPHLGGAFGRRGAVSGHPFLGLLGAGGPGARARVLGDAPESASPPRGARDPPAACPPECLLRESRSDRAASPVSAARLGRRSKSVVWPFC